MRDLISCSHYPQTVALISSGTDPRRIIIGQRTR
jgi:hypothetical protein